MVENKPVEVTRPKEVKKPEPKMILESDLIVFKKSSTNREDKLRNELVDLKGKLAEVESALKIAKVNADDEGEVSEVKKFLFAEEKRIQGLQATYEKDLTSFQERERGVRAKELATEYGIDVESIGVEDDMEKAALRLYAGRLAEEKKALEEKKPTPESVFETGPGGVIKTSPKDMSDKDFDDYVKARREEALSRK